MRRKERLANGETYHIFNKSIAGFKIFNNDVDFLRVRNTLRYYQLVNLPCKFSRFIESEKVRKNGFDSQFIAISQVGNKLVKIITYCVMPTHIHLILHQLIENGIAIFMANVLNSYARYFNIKHKRGGPLWQSRFKNVLVDSDEYLLHLTRYVHLNPVTAYLVDKPCEWIASSYKEYLLKEDHEGRLCEYEDILDVEPVMYKEFVEDTISYQRELVKIKGLLLEEPNVHPGGGQGRRRIGR